MTRMPGNWRFALGGGEGDELRGLRDRHGHIIFNGRAFALLGVGDLFAHLPDGKALGGAAGERGIEHDALSMASARLFKFFAKVGESAEASDQLHQTQCAARSERGKANFGEVFRIRSRPRPPMYSKALNGVVEMAAAEDEQIERSLR